MGRNWGVQGEASVGGIRGRLRGHVAATPHWGRGMLRACLDCLVRLFPPLNLAAINGSIFGQAGRLVPARSLRS